MLLTIPVAIPKTVVRTGDVRCDGVLCTIFKVLWLGWALHLNAILSKDGVCGVRVGTIQVRYGHVVIDNNRFHLI